MILSQAKVGALRKDFPMLRNFPLMQGKRFCYLDSAATSFKPERVIEATSSYYREWNANTHRGDYDLAHLADRRYREARAKVASFLNASFEEVVFTSGDTEGMNAIAYGLCSTLNPGDEIVLSPAEHASNVLPWIVWAKAFSLKVVFAPLDEQGGVSVSNVEKAMTPKTKVLSFAHVSNVLGNVLDARGMADLAHANGALLVLDGAQSVPHRKVDVAQLDCDFLAFSGHKMCGPSGIGVLYGKRKLLERIPPLLSGGGMNASFDTSCQVSYEELPFKFEAGTRNVAGAYGLSEAIDYLQSVGMDRIDAYERKLKKEVVEALKDIPGIVVYNPLSPCGIVDFNREGIFSQDEGTLLNHQGICVRSGLHCAKALTGFLPKSGTVRASFYLYNDRDDVAQFVGALREGGDPLDAYFA